MLNTIIMLEGSDATCLFSMQGQPGSSSIAERNSYAN
jgi:hypothetical protein